MSSDDLQDFLDIARQQKWKGSKRYDPSMLGDEAVGVFNTQIKKKQAKFGKLSDAWDQLVPAGLAEHASLASFVRGTLTVHVDSSSHLFELKQLMLAGLQDQLLMACRAAGLKKIALKRGSAVD
ncbi:MAG: DciA family protein [Tepidisphaeraceae bacterium]